MKIGQQSDPRVLLALIALEEFPDMTYGAIPVVDYRDALEAYLAFDDGALAEVPHALAAYMDHHRSAAI
jgi:hypothetical protein